MLNVSIFCLTLSRYCTVEIFPQKVVACCVKVNQNSKVAAKLSVELREAADSGDVSL